MERTIRVTGRGKLSVPPDTIRLPVTAEGRYPDYAEAMRHSAEDTESVRDAVAAAGLDPKDLKTAHFGINTEYESVQDKDGNWIQRFAGYRYEHRMTIRFPLDSDRLSRVMEQMSRCPAAASFYIEYTVKDPEKIRNRLLKQAVSDSRKKAETLTRAAGVTLGDVVSIDYSWGEIEIRSRPMNAVMMDKAAMPEEAGGFGMSMEPEDISVEDTVTVVWSIR